MKSKLKISLLSGAAAAATMVIGASSAFATNGMLPTCIGTYKCGMGGAGVGYATDASNAAINPALGGRLGNEAIISAGWFKAKVTGEVNGTAAVNANQGPQTSQAKDFANGSIGVNFVVDDTYTFNLTMFPGGGGSSNWKIGRTQTGFGNANGTNGDSKIRYRMFYLQPSIAIKASETSTYGIGVILSRSDIKGDPLGRSSQFPATPNKKETANGIGFQLGGVWDISKEATLGLNYRSPVWHEQFNTNYTATFNGAVNTPQQLTGGVAVQNVMTDGLTVAVDGKWVNWGGIDTIGGLEPVGGGFGWQDQFVFMAGLEYDVSDSAAVRVGYNYGNSPIDETHVFANFLFPAVVEQHFTAGASLGITDGIELGVSGYYAPANKVTDSGQGDSYSQGGSGTWLKMGQHGGQVSVKVAF